MKRGSLMLKTLLAEVKEFKKASILTPLFAFAEVIMEMIIPLLMASIIDKGVNLGDTHHIYVIGAWMVVTAICSLTFGCLAANYAASASMGLGRNLRKAMFEKIQTYSFANLDKFNTASLVTRLTTDVTNIQNAYQMILRMCVRAVSTLIVAMIASFFISPRLALIYLIAVILLGSCLALIVFLAMRYFQEAFRKYDDLNESVQENVSAIRVVKAYVRGDYEKKRFTKASRNIYDMLFKAESVVVWNSPLMQLTVYSCILLISWFGAHMVVGSSLETGDLLALLTYCMNILMSLMMLSMVFVMISMSVASARRIAEVINEESTLHNPADPCYDIADGSIRFDHVTFRYSKNAEELPQKMKQVNENLMILSMEYFYAKIKINTQESKEIEEWINQVRIDLKKNIIKKQNRDINNREIYAYLHDICGPQVLDLFDVEMEASDKKS